MTQRTLTVTSNAIQRRGYRPFRRSIGDALGERALSDTMQAFILDNLESLRKGHKVRNA